MRKRDLSCLLLRRRALSSARLGELSRNAAIEGGILAAAFLLETQGRPFDRVENVAKV